MRVNMNIPDELVSQIDAKAKSLFVNRTAWIIMTLSQKLQQDCMVDKMPDMLEVFNRFSSDDMQERSAACIERPQTRDNPSSE